MKNADKPISPLKGGDGTLYTDGNEHEFIASTGAFVGLTKREYFAGLAMTALVGSGDLMDADIKAKQSVRMADALLKELEKSNES